MAAKKPCVKEGCVTPGIESLIKWVNGVNAEANRLNTIREQLIRMPPKCPACGTEQVQLIEYHHNPVIWKCRHCKHVWESTYD